MNCVLVTAPCVLYPSSDKLLHRPPSLIKTAAWTVLTVSLCVCVPSVQDMYMYTSRHLMRVYPGGLRVSSSNYDPSNAWTLGACDPSLIPLILSFSLSLWLLLLALLSMRDA